MDTHSTLPAAQKRRRACIHHWVLGDPAHGEITGRCRRCKATRLFPASPESSQRFDDYRELMSDRTYYAARPRS
jgi:hypothetical protein